ncbi:MAG TPA: Gfo/Idh/MocA family oxidoreductase [Verrucomicrobiota bacterium]|nr:Gfo/Idh/MocA family oxidoreductase [Verrucomicrobiota bacterium]
MSPRHRSRRQFLKGATLLGLAAGFPTAIPARVLGAEAPSKRIAIGAIGLGGMGSGNLGGFLGDPRCRVLAVNDVDRRNLQAARQRVNQHYGNQDCTAYSDFRELLARDDIDAISLATPDHWHAIPAILAAKSGKDVYGEKPFSHDLREGRAMVTALNRYGRVWQTGSWQRSTGDFRFACELVRNGRIGKVHTVEVGLPTGSPGGNAPFTNPPPDLDYDFWCGPSPWAPYSQDRTHWNWRWQMDYGGGQLMDWIGHHGDIAQWGLGTEHTGPVEVNPIHAEFPKTGIWDAATRYRVECKFANGVTVILQNAEGQYRMGAKWIGTEGWVWVDRGGFETHPATLKQEKIRPEEINLYRSTNHIGNFIDCVLSRRLTITPAEVAHRSASLGHLAVVALALGRKFRWNPETEQILDDPTAGTLLGRAKREPWNIIL